MVLIFRHPVLRYKQSCVPDGKEAARTLYDLLEGIGAQPELWNEDGSRLERSELNGILIT